MTVDLAELREVAAVFVRVVRSWPLLQRRALAFALRQIADQIEAP